jgi:hypothetical protein
MLILMAQPETTNEVKLSEAAVCDRCGKFGAFEFDGATLCQDCFQGCGSCCPEFGADDLWEKNKE